MAYSGNRETARPYVARSISVILCAFAAFIATAFADSAWAAAPPAPTNLIASMASSRQINLTWTDNATTESNYYVERSPNGTSSWTVVGTLGANITSYQNTGLTQNTRYYYRVRCKAGSTYSSYSATANATTATLAAPTSLAAAVASATQITLNWTDNTAYETQYSIERSPNGSSSWTVLGTVATNVTTTTNSGLTAGTAYYYRVRAYDSTNYSAYSNTANQTIRTITASAGANGSINPSGTVGVANGGTKAFTMTPNSGYKIATVTVNGGAVATNPTYTFTNVTTNQTINATFSVNTFTITASAGPNGSISPSGAVVVTGGTTTTFTFTPNSGYHVSDVLVDGVSQGTPPSYTFSNVTAPHTISVSFSNTYAITATANASGVISPSGVVNVVQGTNQAFTITPNTNYHISDVAVDLVSVGTPSLYTFPSVTTTHSIVASFAINTFTITASAGANGSLSPSGTFVANAGSQPAFTATPSAGYHVLDIQVDGSSVGSAPTYTFLPVTANHTIAANFSNVYLITATSGTNGTITPSGAVNATQGLDQTFTIAPDVGYKVADVLVDGVSKGTVTLYTFPTVSAPHTISATFSVQTFTITATAGSGGTVSPSGGIAVPKGTDQAVTITPNNGFWITDVLVDGQSVGPVTSYLFTNVTATHTISASFADRTVVPGGRISSNTTWTRARSPYIVNSTIQTYGTTTMPVTMTIEPGVTVRFVGGAGIQVGYVGGLEQGAFIAQGTPSERITFTRDGTNTWGGITFYNGTVDNTTIIENADIQYSATMVMYNASPTLRDSTLSTGAYMSLDLYSSNPVLTNLAITTNGLAGMRLDTSSPVITGGSLVNSAASGYGILGQTSSCSPVISNYVISTTKNSSFYGIRLPITTSNLSITNSTIANGLYLGSANITPTITGNTITNVDTSPLHMGANIIGQVLNNNSLSGPTAVKFEVLGENIKQDALWKNYGAPYVISGLASVYSSSTTTATLTVEPGAVLKFESGGGLQVGSSTQKGRLVSQGTSTSRIVFTSSQATPTPGYWSGISLIGATAGTSVLEYVKIEYGGAGGLPPANYSPANLKLDRASPVLRNCVIRYSAGSGIYLENATSWPMILDSEISNNAWGISTFLSNPFVSNSMIAGNSQYAVYNPSTSIDVDARGNWWGLATGPTSSSTPGNRVSAHVLYNPWLGQAPGEGFRFTDSKVVPTSLNPDGDFVVFVSKLTSTADWTLTITDGNNATVRTLTGSGSTMNQRWYGENDQAVKVADGAYNYRITAVSQATGETAVAPLGMVVASRQIPVAILDLPADDQMFTGGSVIAVTGSAYDAADFHSYTLEYGPGENPTTWYSLPVSGYPAVTSGQIHAWDTSQLTGGVYALKLTVTDWAGNFATETSRVRLLWTQNSAASEQYFSPNGDLEKDATMISASFTHDSAWTVRVKDASTAVVKTFTGTGTTLAQVWDGKDEDLQVVSDGTYTYQIDATSTETGIAVLARTGTVTVDTAVPTALITAPTGSAVLWNTVVVSGTAMDANFESYRIEYGPPSGAGPWSTITTTTTTVAGGQLGSWITNDPSHNNVVPNGDYIVLLAVNDRAGNVSYASVPITLDNLTITGVGASRSGIDSFAGETASVFFTLNTSATATVKFYRESQGSGGVPVRQASLDCPAGACSFIWDGKDGAGLTVADEAYIYVIEASNGTRSVTYDPPAPPATGAETVACSQEAGFDPYKGDPLAITYQVSHPARVTISGNWAGYPFAILSAYPQNETAVSHTYDWDGGHPEGTVIRKLDPVACSIDALLHTNSIVTTGDLPRITMLQVDPYQMNIAFGQFTTISYHLNRDALVSLQLAIGGSSVAPLSTTPELKAAGDHTYEWRGLVDAAAGRVTMISKQGDHTLTVTAENPTTHRQAKKKIFLKVGY